MDIVDINAKILWDYMKLNMELQKSECIFVLGSNDLRVAKYSAQLYLNGYGDYIVFSGGYGNFTKGNFIKPEAELFADIAMEMGVPQDKIIIENKASNTGENVAFTLELLKKKNIIPKNWILVQKPFMERRSLATFKKYLPNVNASVTSPQIDYYDYSNKLIPKENLINVMVGDMQRIIEYPKKGFMVYEYVPNYVEDALNNLITLGYTNHLIK